MTVSYNECPCDNVVSENLFEYLNSNVQRKYSNIDELKVKLDYFLYYNHTTKKKSD